jgi:flagellar biosynthesis protein FliQ
MGVEQALDIGREALLIGLLISSPMLLAGLVVGLVLSLLQAVTQIQEQTLTFVPKIIAMAVAAVVFLPWIAQKMLEYSARLFGPF